MTLPKIGDSIELLEDLIIGSGCLVNKINKGTICQVNPEIFPDILTCTDPNNIGFYLDPSITQYRIIPKPSVAAYKVGNIIKYIGPDRHAFDGIKTELVVHGQVLIINEIDEYGYMANTVNTNHAARKMNLRIGPEHMESVNNLPTSCKMDAEEMKIQNQISEAMAYKPRDKVDLIEHWQLKTDKETIDHPEWYNKGIETIDFIDSWSLNFELGNVVKYVTRSPYKGTQKDDLLKALWYLCREMKRVGYGQELTDFCKKEANGTEKIK